MNCCTIEYQKSHGLSTSCIAKILLDISTEFLHKISCRWSIEWCILLSCTLDPFKVFQIILKRNWREQQSCGDG